MCLCTRPTFVAAPLDLVVFFHFCRLGGRKHLKQPIPAWPSFFSLSQRRHFIDALYNGTRMRRNRSTKTENRKRQRIQKKSCWCFPHTGILNLNIKKVNLDHSDFYAIKASFWYYLWSAFHILQSVLISLCIWFFFSGRFPTLNSTCPYMQGT